MQSKSLTRAIWAIIKWTMVRIYIFIIIPALIIVGFYGIFVFVESPTITQVFDQIFSFIFR